MVLTNSYNPAKPRRSQEQARGNPHLSLEMSAAESEEKKEANSFSELHSVRKPPAKPWRRPERPAPPKFYRVDPRGFRQLVQRLTGAPQAAARPLKATAPTPAPLKLTSRMLLPQQLSPAFDYNTMASKETSEHQSVTSSIGLSSPPLFSPWFSFSLLSPGTMAALENSTRTGPLMH